MFKRIPASFIQNSIKNTASCDVKYLRRFCSHKPSEQSQTLTQEAILQSSMQGGPTKAGVIDAISKSNPTLGKVMNYLIDSWEQTFPSDQYHAKAEKARMLAREEIEKELQKKILTEEELAKIQEQIPEWKQFALAEYDVQSHEKPSILSKISSTLKDKINQTEVAKTLYKTEQYKEYEEFKKEMSQFKEDLHDHLGQSQNVAVIASMALIGKATSESSSAMAIREMRKQMPNFDVFNLERDVKGIFSDIFNAYLKGELSYLEKTCEEVGLAYFKAMMKKREIDGVYPKFTNIWSAEQAEFVGAKMSERNMPSFTFTVQIQEIYCNISKKTGKVVDGEDDRLVQNKYQIVLSPAENPDIATVGHRWVITEIHQLENVLMLA